MMRRLHSTVQATGLVALLAIALTAALGAAAGGAALEKGTPPPGLPSFYGVPAPLPSATPGAVIKTERIASPKVDGTTYRIMYVSENTRGRPIAVTGTVLVPRHPRRPPAATRWWPGPTAPTAWPRSARRPSTPVQPQPTQRSPSPISCWRRAGRSSASDYQGEGTPGPLPYLVGSVSARNTLDIVRAVDHVPVVPRQPDLRRLGPLRGRSDGAVRPPPGALLRPHTPPGGRGRRCAAVAVQPGLHIPEDKPVPVLPLHGGRRVQHRLRQPARAADRSHRPRRHRSCCPTSRRAATHTSRRRSTPTRSQGS